MVRVRYCLSIALSLVALAAFAPPLSAVAQPPNLRLQPVVTTGLNQPLFVTSPPGDGNRLFIVEKGGRIRIFDRQTNSLLTSPYLTVPVSSDGERGLLGLAFDPDFASNGRFYVDYTRGGSGGDVGDIVVARYQASGNPMTSNTAISTGTPLLTIEHSQNNNHNGGWIGFRPNDPGRLYVAVGDGGSGNDPPNNAQNVNVLLGKMLRIDVSGPGAYSIPSDNPFASGGGAPEIYDYGLRNPWRNSFDRQTGDLWIADVGQSALEEIDFHAAGTPGGLNFGWRSKEGTLITGLNGPGPFPGLTDPIHEYGFGGTRETVTGGYVYRGGSIPSMQGHYFFGDFLLGRIWTLQKSGSSIIGPVEWTSQLDPDGPGGFSWAQNLASFGEDASGELYMVALGSGDVYKVIPEPSALIIALLGVPGFIGLAARQRFRSRR